MESDARAYNVLWPLARFDHRHNTYRIFPFFWSDDHTIGFPLYWHFGDPFGDIPRGSDSLWPLWCYFRDGEQRSLHLAWPFFNLKDYRDERGGHLWPLFGRYEDPTRRSGYAYAAWPIGWHTWSPTASSWTLAPLFHRSRGADGAERTDLTLLGGWWRDAAEDRTGWFALPLLGWGGSNADGRADNALLGLWHRHDDERGRAQWLIPFYYRSRDDDGRNWAIYPLLSGGRRQQDGGELWLLGPLFHADWDDTGSSHWLFPLYYYDADTWLTPLAGRWDSESTTNRYLLTPLFGLRSGAESGSWLFPLYSYRHDRQGNITRGSFLLAGSYRHGPHGGELGFPLLFNYRRWDEPAVAADRRAATLDGWQFDALLIARFANRSERAAVGTNALPVVTQVRQARLFPLFGHRIASSGAFRGNRTAHLPSGKVSRCCVACWC